MPLPASRRRPPPDSARASRLSHGGRQAARPARLSDPAPVTIARSGDAAAYQGLPGRLVETSDLAGDLRAVADAVEDATENLFILPANSLIHDELIYQITKSKRGALALITKEPREEDENGDAIVLDVPIEEARAGDRRPDAGGPPRPGALPPVPGDLGGLGLPRGDPAQLRPARPAAPAPQARGHAGRGGPRARRHGPSPRARGRPGPAPGPGPGTARRLGRRPRPPRPVLPPGRTPRSRPPRRWPRWPRSTRTGRG